MELKISKMYLQTYGNLFDMQAYILLFDVHTQYNDKLETSLLTTICVVAVAGGDRRERGREKRSYTAPVRAALIVYNGLICYTVPLNNGPITRFTIKILAHSLTFVTAAPSPLSLIHI